MGHHQVTILGSGTSTGIPMVGCSCPVCLSTDPHDNRTRCSVLLQTQSGKSILIDTSTDLRFQLLANKVQRVDAALITHDHADHVHGIDDLRPLGYFTHGRERIPIYTEQEIGNHLIQRFPYIFRPHEKPLGGGIPRLRLSNFVLGEEPVEVLIEGERFILFYLPHGRKKTVGFCHGKLGYVVDCHEVPEKIQVFLQSRQLDLLIIECVQEKAHETHLGSEATFEIIKKVGPKAAGLTHIGHQFSHQSLGQLAGGRFPYPVFPLYDGQKWEYCNE